jgi:hypothetical protein
MGKIISLNVRINFGKSCVGVKEVFEGLDICEVVGVEYFQPFCRCWCYHQSSKNDSLL